MLGYFEDLGYVGRGGCIGVILRTALLIYAILCLFADFHNWHAWLILVGEVIQVLFYISSQRIMRKRYNRKDSYWSKKHNNVNKQQ